jgi:hypothetical protein
MVIAAGGMAAAEPPSRVGNCFDGNGRDSALGASISAEGNVARAMFDVAGPMLSLSVAMLIGRTPDLRDNPAV